MSQDREIEIKTYGYQFVEHLRELSDEAPFNYSDLHAIRKMNRTELAVKMAEDSKGAATIVSENEPIEAARMVSDCRKEAKMRETMNSCVALSLLDVVVRAVSSL